MGQRHLPVDLLPRAPTDTVLTPYDRAHAALYFQLVDAAEAGADWRKVVALALAIEPAAPDARAIWASHLARARWFVETGWRQLTPDTGR